MVNESGRVSVHGGRLVLENSVVDDGVVIVVDAIIEYAGPMAGVPPRWTQAIAAGINRTTGYIMPGLVDIHCHGGGGGSFPDALTSDDAISAITEHRRHGTTSLVASLVTQSPDVLRDRIALLRGLVEDDQLAGIHLEGPFISAARCGAQDPKLIQQPDPALAAELCELARGAVVTMTLAPEIPGNVGLNSVTQALIEAGALPSYGHTDAAAGQMRAAILQARSMLSGISARSAHPSVTHLFNGMRPLQHREAGPVLDALTMAARGEAVVELVGDGTHLDPAVVREVFEMVGADHIMLVTDAMAAAGMPDGSYRLGSLDVVVDGGVARLAAGDGAVGAIAGGTAHLLDVVRTTVTGGVPLPCAVRAATATPARVIGRTDIGRLRAGGRADLLMTDHDLQVQQVWRGGELVLT